MIPEPDVTALLVEISNGNQAAQEKLLPLVYDQLKRLARRYMRRERADHTLQTTALVHEAYLKLVGQHSPHWQDRAQFYGTAAQLMRRILIDHAREAITVSSKLLTLGSTVAFRAMRSLSRESREFFRVPVGWSPGHYTLAGRVTSRW